MWFTHSLKKYVLDSNGLLLSSYKPKCVLNLNQTLFSPLKKNSCRLIIARDGVTVPDKSLTWPLSEGPQLHKHSYQAGFRSGSGQGACRVAAAKRRRKSATQEFLLKDDVRDRQTKSIWSVSGVWTGPGCLEETSRPEKNMLTLHREALTR